MDKDWSCWTNGFALAGANRVDGGFAGGALFSSEFKLWARTCVAGKGRKAAAHRYTAIKIHAPAGKSDDGLRRHGERIGLALNFGKLFMEAIMPAPTGLIQQLDQFLHKNPLLPRQSRILVACSGGADSVALLHLLAAINRSDYWQWKLVIGHVNHNLRPTESRLDEALVRHTAGKLDIPLAIRRLRWREKSRNPRRKVTVQNAAAPADRPVSENRARIARLAALESMARQRRCSVLVMAHHADDQAETVLLRLLRGAGAGGLRGIRSSRRMGADGSLRLVRPLLGWPRRALREWLSAQDIQWREDSSNQSTRFLRNRIRIELLPLLEQYQPGIRNVLHLLAANQRQLHMMLGHTCRRVLQKAIIIRKDTEWRLHADALRRCPAAAATLALRQAIVAVGGRAGSISGASLMEAQQAIRNQVQPIRRQFSGRVELEVRHGVIRIFRGQKTKLKNRGKPASRRALKAKRGPVNRRRAKGKR